MKIYVACSLTHASEEFKQRVEDFKAKLRMIPGVEVLCFNDAGSNPTSLEIYQHCVAKCVERSDLLIAICDLPSTGLGMEIAIQVLARHKPAIALAQKEAKISDMVIGCDQPGYEFHRYEILTEDGFSFVENRIKSTPPPEIRLAQEGDSMLIT